MRKPFLIFLGMFVLFIAASFVAAVVYFSNCGLNPFKDQLLREANQRFQPRTSLAEIEAWANSEGWAQRAEVQGPFHQPIQGAGDLHEDEAKKAGLDTSKIYCVIRLEYKEQRCLENYEVHLFFFFDQDDKLVKVWTSEWIPSL